MKILAAGSHNQKWLPSISIGGVLRTNDPFKVQAAVHKNAPTPISMAWSRNCNSFADYLRLMPLILCNGSTASERTAGEGDSNAVPFPRPLLLLGDAKTPLRKRKLCPKKLCRLRGSPQSLGPFGVQNSLFICSFSGPDSHKSNGIISNMAEACGSRTHHSTREGPNRRL